MTSGSSSIGSSRGLAGAPRLPAGAEGVAWCGVVCGWVSGFGGQDGGVGSGAKRGAQTVRSCARWSAPICVDCSGGLRAYRLYSSDMMIITTLFFRHELYSSDGRLLVLQPCGMVSDPYRIDDLDHVRRHAAIPGVHAHAHTHTHAHAHQRSERKPSG